MKFTIFDRPFFGHYYYILGLSDPCLEVEKKIFREIHQFYIKKLSPCGMGGREIYNFLSPYPLDATYQI